MELDWLIFKIACVVGIFSWHGFSVIAWSGLNIVLIDWYITNRHWDDIVLWAILFSLKDFALMPLARNSLIIVYALAASCIFHQVVLMQILTYTWENVTLFEYRSEFMLYLAVIMLATVVHSMIGGGSNGGRRIGDSLFGRNCRMGRVFYLASQKDSK